MRNLSVLKTQVLAFFLLLAPLFPLAQQPDSTASVTGNSADTLPSAGIFDLISKKEIAEIKLSTDIDALMKKRKKNEYEPGVFTWRKNRKESWSIPVKIKCRGKFRRMKCDFPPLKLKFKKKNLASEGLNDFNELKLVTHCLDERERSRELVLREYLTYCLYNLLTPYSFRVQLVKVHYENTARKSKKIRQYGILIEDAEELAYRMGGEISKQMGTPLDSLHRKQEMLVALFQCMISNADWDYVMCRNVELIKMPTDGRVLLVPYDFDFSGLVAAPYARVDSNLGQKNVRDRVYLGTTNSLSELRPVLKYYLSKEDDILGFVDHFDALSAESREDVHNYLESFFTNLKDEKKAAAMLSIHTE
ncbi:MAG: hypothetical protein ACE5FF_12715 [Saprospiraceae bacterium]